MKQIRKNILTTTSLNIFTYLVPLIVTPYFVRISGAENFGLLNIAQTVVQYFFLFVGFNLDITVSGDIAVNKNDKERIRKIFWETVYARLVLLTVSSVFFLVVLWYFKSLNKDTFLLALTFIGLIGYAITPLWFYQGMENFMKLFLFVVIGKIAFAIVIFAFVKQQEDFWFYSLALSLSQIISGALLLAYPIYKFNLIPIKFKWKEILLFLIAKFPFFRGGTVVNFCSVVNVTILSFILTLKDFGLYMAANKLILVFFSLITLPLNQSLYPLIARSITENFDSAILKIRQKMVPGLTYFSLIVILLLFIFSKLVIWIMLGPYFFDVITPFKLMLFSIFANVVTNVIAMQLFVKLNLVKSYLKITQVSAFSSIVLTTVLAYFFGIYGAAISWLVSEFFIFIYSIRQLNTAGIRIFHLEYLHPKKVLSFCLNSKFISFLK